ncbi:MAG: hypothetical protein NC293_07745, partial [Roseburia sp.]|nr:hypothetical protein [Roseburia sp.]
TLKSYSTIKADWRVIGNDSDVQNKRLYCYFDQFDAIKTTDAFAASGNATASSHVSLGKDAEGKEVSTVVAAGAPNESREVRFGVNISMAEGVDKESGITLSNGATSKENSKWLPSYYSAWKVEDPTTHYSTDSCTTGFKWAEADAYTAGFATKYLTFNTARINEADATLLDQSKFDVVIGTTYKGDSQLSGNSVFYYVDNIALVEEDIPLTGFDLSFATGADRVGQGKSTKVNVAYTPQDSTQKELIWTSSSAQVKVDSEGNITVPEDFDFGGQTEVQVEITATAKANPALTKKVTITVYKLESATEPYVLDFETMYDAELSGDLTVEKTTDDNSEPCWQFNLTDKNQRIYFKLPEEINLSAYDKYEIIGWAPDQMSLDFFDATLPAEMAKTEQPGNSGYEWWKTAPAATYPFYDGSSSNRLSDGTWVAPNDKETLTGSLSGIKQSKAEQTDPDRGNYDAVKYIAIGNATGANFVNGDYLIYSFRLLPKQSDSQDSEHGETQAE